MAKKIVGLLIGLLILAGCAAQDKSLENRKMVREIKKLDLEVKETDRGVEIIFPEVLLFDYNSDRLKPGAKAKMHQIAEVVNDPMVAFRIVSVEGHADFIGSDAFNLDLSQRRAQSVARALVFSGVRKERLAVKGFGESKPIAPNTNPDGTDNPEGRARNRRVEVIIEN